MSQKFSIVSVKHSGSPVYTGQDDDCDVYSSNPRHLLTWLSDGWRFRFNQHRSNRLYYKNVDGVKTEVPLSDNPVKIKDSEAKRDFSWLSAIPSMVIQTATNKEKSEWSAAAKRKKKRGGSMPGYRSRRTSSHIFVCFHNNGANANVQRCGKKTYVLTISGQNPTEHRKYGFRWKLKLRIRTGNQVIRDYTSVIVDTVNMTVVFVNEPLALEKSPGAQSCFTDVFVYNQDKTKKDNYDAKNYFDLIKVKETLKGDSKLGCDRGGVIPVAASDGKRYHAPKSIAKLEEQIECYQRQLSVKRDTQEKRAEQLFYANNGISSLDDICDANHRKKLESQLSSTLKMARIKATKTKNYQRIKRKLNSTSAKKARVLDSWRHELSSKLVKEHSVIVLEDLKIYSMTRKGGNKKKGMNRSTRRYGLADLQTKIVYKNNLAGGVTVLVNPAYTSLTCHKCHEMSRENRESQAIFVCHNTECGYRGNADDNAGKNIQHYADLYGILLDNKDNLDDDTLQALYEGIIFDTTNMAAGVCVRLKPTYTNVIKWVCTISATATCDKCEKAHTNANHLMELLDCSFNS